MDVLSLAAWILQWIVRLWLIWLAWHALVVPKLLHPLLRRLRLRRWHPPTAGDPFGMAVDRFHAVEAPDGAMAAALVMPTGEKCYFAGHVDGRHAPKPDGETRFEIGSITKTFTATLLLAMQRAGHVELDTPVDRLLSPSQRLGRQEPRAMTLQDLATHRSGLPRLPWGLPMLAGLYLYPRQPYAWISERVVFAWLRRRRVRGVGQHYRYSNLAFGVLGLLLAREARTSYGEALHRCVLEPLGMRSTSLAGSSPAVDPSLAQPHSILGRRVSAWNLRALEAAGGLRSSLHDMLRWLHANLALTEPVGAAMHSPRADGLAAGRRIALGWHVDGHGDDIVVWHNGGTRGSRSFMGFMPARRLGVVVLCSQAISVDALGLTLLRAARQGSLDRSHRQA